MKLNLSKKVPKIIKSVPRTLKKPIPKVMEKLPEMSSVIDKLPEMPNVMDKLPEMSKVKEMIPEVSKVKEMIPEVSAVKEKLTDINMETIKGYEQGVKKKLEPVVEKLEPVVEKMEPVKEKIEPVLSKYLEREPKAFSGVNELPGGTASDNIVKGCVVVEGGAFRGLYASGVLDAMMKHDLNLECTVGVSAGAMNGINYVAGQIGRSGRVNLKYRHDGRYVGFHAMMHNQGLIGFDFVLGGGLDDTDPLNTERFYSPDREFVAVATDVITGQAEYFKKSECEDIMQAVRASASMPYLSQPGEIGTSAYLDGGCSVKIAVDWAIEQGYEKIIVIRTRDKAFRYTEEACEKSYKRAKAFYKDYPLFAERLGNSSADYNTLCDHIEALEAEGRVYVIYPSRPPHVSRVEGDMEKLGGLYYQGYGDTLSQIQEIREYLGVVD